MNGKESTTWQEAAALERFQMISPLLDEELDRDKKIQLRKEKAKQYDVSEKTLRRYEKAYADAGFAGLKPAERSKHRIQGLPENFDDLLQEAIQLKREVPTRSVNQIIFILEGEGKVAPGVLKRSTLQRHLFEAGFGRRQMQQYVQEQEASSRRFCKPHRMMLLQADIKYGPKLPIGKGGRKVQTYLTSLIDDHSRYILASTFYNNQEQTVVEDTFRKAILAYGKFDAAYCDNGSQYISRQLIRSCSMLGIRIRHAKPRSGKSKGKIEKFHQVVDAYLAEAKAKKIRTLEELNRYWSYYLEGYYQKRAHDGIREYYEQRGVSLPESGISPEMEWNRDSRPLVFLDAGRVGEAFLYHEERIVDKGGCISFRGVKYEVSAALIGAKVTIAYDPIAADTITVSYRDMEPITAHKVKIGAFCDKTPQIPVSMMQGEPETSRMLDVLEKEHHERMEKQANAISYGAYRKDGE